MHIWLYGQGEEGEKDSYSTAVLDAGEYIDLTCEAPSFKRFLMINSS